MRYYAVLKESDPHLWKWFQRWKERHIVHFDFIGAVVPAACLGSASRQLLLYCTLPLVGIALVFVVCNS